MIGAKCFGASVCGERHKRNFQSNQDSWLMAKRSWGSLIVVSDGLGSKKLSKLGSDAACMASWLAAHESQRDMEFSTEKWCQSIITNWLELLKGVTPNECSSTLLSAFYSRDNTLNICVLGDGAAVIELKSGSIKVMQDRNSMTFANTTSCLSKTTKFEDWTTLQVPPGGAKSVILLTDGISESISDLDSFSKSFLNSHRELPTASACRRTHQMLSDWPIESSDDDKSMACMCLHGVSLD
jgi:serine/threonine protein phosphatase PrpC